ncbi:MAG: hypothetical protein D6683_05820 [Actinomyces sp.]|nr:MAG: hypothetical protein D6683_05820 [Actinomyces sp.]
MSDAPPPDDPAAAPGAVRLGPRLEEFRREVQQLGLTGGRSNPERLGLRLSVLVFAVAVVLEIVAYVVSSNATDPRDQTDMVILALLGVVLALGAVAGFVRFALTRWFRYWLIRLVYEHREATDRVVDAVRRS